MKIYSMTATFGKLNHETLTLKPGLNIIEAPNEWGKSTWCAFLMAMLYGINTREQTKTGFLADKEHYAPWSGAPMSGSMDIHWNGRDITIQRRNKGRGVFNDFKAFETETGLEVAELTAANCGQQLLGVEQSVFARAGFVRLKDMPLTQDESLRRRLNALVTTGDESSGADDLARKLKDVKNRCRFNRSGLLPQAETQQRELMEKLQEAESLQSQVVALERRQQELKDHQARLTNHRQALQYDQDRNFAGKLAMTRAQLEIAAERVEALERVCASLPNPKMLELKKLQLQQLLEKKDALQMEIQLQPPAPQAPEPVPQFQGMDPVNAVEHAHADTAEYAQLQDGIKRPSPILWILGLLVLVVGAVLLALMKIPYVLILGAVVTLTGALLHLHQASRNTQLRHQLQLLERKYAPLPAEVWMAEAQRYAQTQTQYREALTSYRDRMQQLEERYRAILTQLDTMTGGQSAASYEQQAHSALEQHRAYADALREHSRLEEMVATMESSHREVLPPDMPDELTFTLEETERMLSDAAVEGKQLHQRLGQCQGRMEALGDPRVLAQQLDSVNNRIRELEKIYNATVLAQQTLETARQELQRRFAPRISQRAQEIFEKLTGGRYRRIALQQDLSVSTAAEGEDTLRGTLWRSDGTADQLYLALRLAVAQELTPGAPLVLDDALVRFDDSRLKEILKLLNQTGSQVLLFTCHSREQKIMEELS